MFDESSTVGRHLLRILVEMVRIMNESSVFTQVRALPYVPTNISIFLYSQSHPPAQR